MISHQKLNFGKHPKCRQRSQKFKYDMIKNEHSKLSINFKFNIQSRGFH